MAELHIVVRRGKVNPYDPDMLVDYTGTAYTLKSVPVNPPLPRKAR